MMGRLLALAALVMLSPLLLLIALAVVLDSGLPIFFRQQRIGKNGVPFSLVKFRSMRSHAEKAGKLTVGVADARITRIGRLLRKYKLDELPQLYNVMSGAMQWVGPRPEVPEYVSHYTSRQREVLRVRPGITDYASLKYFDENELLAQSADPQRTYVEEVMPAKLEINLEYLSRKSSREDLRIVWLTLKRMFKAAGR